MRAMKAIVYSNFGLSLTTPGIYSSFALKFVSYLDGKKAALRSMPEDISILAYEKAKGDYYRLAG